jgi:hypothetical protein
LHVGGKDAVCEVFGGLHALAAKAADLDAAGARGVYFTPNPIRPDLIGSRVYAKYVNVIRRRWLLIDCDSRRASGWSATHAERTAAWSVMGSVFATLAAWGMVGAVTGDSGNGYRLCYPIDPGLPRCSAVRVNCCLSGVKQILLRGDTDVTQCFASVYRAEPDLRHGPCSLGEPFPARTARRTVFSGQHKDSTNARSCCRRSSN